MGIYYIYGFVSRKQEEGVLTSPVLRSNIQTFFSLTMYSGTFYNRNLQLVRTQKTCNTHEQINCE